MRQRHSQRRPEWVTLIGLSVCLLAVTLVPSAPGHSVSDLKAPPFSRQANRFNDSPETAAEIGEDVCEDASLVCTGRPDRIFQAGHTAAVTAVTFSPDGAWLATGSDDTTVRLWEASSGREIRKLTGHDGSIRGLAFSSDGRYLASGNSDGTVKLWDVATGRELRTLMHIAGVTAVSFSPDGKTLAAGCTGMVRGGGTVKVWELATGREIRARASRWNNIMALAFVANNRLLLSASTDENNEYGVVEMYDPEQDRQVLSLPIVAVAFSPDGRWAAAAQGGNNIRLWELATSREGASLPSPSGNMSPAVAFSMDGRWLAARGPDYKSVKIWDVASGTEVQSLVGHTSAVTTLAFSQDGRRIASGSDGWRVRVWDRETGRQESLLSGQGPIVEVAFSPDGKWLAAGSNGYAPAVLKVWNTSEGRELVTLSDQTCPVTSLAVSPDGRWLAANSEKEVNVWDTTSWRLAHTLAGHVQNVTEVVFTPDSQGLISASTDGLVKIWDVRTGRTIHSLRIPIAYLNTVSVSPDGKWLASGGVGEAVEIWEIASGRKLQALAGHKGSVASIAFKPDGQWLATGDSGYSVRMWDLSTGRAEIWIGMGGSGVALSPDGRRLATTDGYGIVKLYETATGTPLQVMMTGEASSGGLAFSPDGVWLASGGLKSTINLWRTLPSR